MVSRPVAQRVGLPNGRSTIFRTHLANPLPSYTTSRFRATQLRAVVNRLWGGLTHNRYEFRQRQDYPETYVKAFAFWVRDT